MYHPEDFEPKVTPFDPGLLTPEERAVLDKLVEARNLYIQLPVQHPLHQQEFTRSLHELQRLVMSRPTSRIEGWVKDEQGNTVRQARFVLTHIDEEGNCHVEIDEVVPSHTQPISGDADIDADQIDHSNDRNLLRWNPK